ncbi:hypothetical protein yfred0001_26370 [Yersinia frederiksenii ATCC 33641]|nr:hypothetical protein yfred0001_26370 [Yersinia frederiksenii ATCC 33641]
MAIFYLPCCATVSLGSSYFIQLIEFYSFDISYIANRVIIYRILGQDG